MNIMKFFRGGTVEQGTETSDVVDELEADEKRQREIKAEAVALERRQTQEYRARNKKTLADFLKRKDSNTQEVNAHVVGLLLALTDTTKLVIESANIPFDGSVSTTEEVFGFPVDFADKLIAAIREAAPQTQWDWSGAGQPTLKGPQTVRLPRFAGDNGPPPGFNGIWDLVKGQPMDPSDEVPFVILPTG